MVEPGFQPWPLGLSYTQPVSANVFFFPEKEKTKLQKQREDELVGWNHQLKGHEFEQTPGDGEGQGSLAYGSPWGCKDSNS